MTGRSAAPAPFRCGTVAIVGRPSVGKSTLLNALVGQKLAITSKRPQTTRHRLQGIVTEPGRQFVFVDTPGFQTKHRSPLNDRMNRTVRTSLADVDVVAWVVEAPRLTAADRAVAALVPASVPMVVALNKIDTLADKSGLLPLMGEIAALRPDAPIVPISAESGLQLAVLKDEIARALPQQPPIHADDTLTDRDERFLAAEFVREKVFRLVGEEIPYAATVTIDRFEHEGNLRRIYASIHVEKTSQRAIVLGAGGERIKAIGSGARRDLEQLFGGPVWLEVWVRVQKNWSGSDASLDRLGY